MTMTVVVVVAGAASVMIVFKTALKPLAIASRISCDSCPHTIIPKSSDGFSQAVNTVGEAAPPPMTLRPLCPDSMFTTRGPEQVVSHTHFTLTLLHVLVVHHIV
jgi:hypothetical protein